MAQTWLNVRMAFTCTMKGHQSRVNLIRVNLKHPTLMLRQPLLVVKDLLIGQLKSRLVQFTALQFRGMLL